MMNWSKWLYLDIDMVHGDLDVPSTSTRRHCPARKYICPARLRGNTPASGEIYFRAGQEREICFRVTSSVYLIIIMDHFVDKHLNFLFLSSRSQDTLQQTHTISLQNIKHATSPLPLPSSVHRRRGRQDPRKTRRTRSHPARWDVAQRSERGRWVEHVRRRSEDEDESEGRFEGVDGQSQGVSALTSSRFVGGRLLNDDYVAGTVDPPSSSVQQRSVRMDPPRTRRT
jgi:hypothetical protein